MHLSDSQLIARAGAQCECDGRCGTPHGSPGGPAPARCPVTWGHWDAARHDAVALTVAVVGTGPRAARIVACPACAHA
ncbi:hypothetical protein ACFC1B_28600 [Streptomyces xiamenensis]|uniref:hypothetical protein n=1 Tax=Streptomyces xiamenensis TaxID=408015 RepID=UPI0035E23248